MYLAPTDEMTSLAKSVFGYNGRKYQVHIATKYRPELYWDGGSKKDARLVCRENLAIAYPSASASDPFKPAAHTEIEIPQNHFIVEHYICRGTDMGVRFYVRPDEADTAMIEAEEEELARNEKIVLLATVMLKSSYSGIKDYRLYSAQQETGISATEYEVAKRSLIDKGFLTKVGGATIKAKNYRDRLPWSLAELARGKE